MTRRLTRAEAEEVLADTFPTSPRFQLGLNEQPDRQKTDTADAAKGRNATPREFAASRS